jgi:hypothetical protein
MAITNRGDTLDKEVVVTNPDRGDDEVGRTVMQLITEITDLKNHKEQTVFSAKELYDNVINGEAPTKAAQLCSYLPVQLVNNFYSLIQIPDVNIINSGYIPELEIAMTRFLEMVVHDGGFKDLMEKGFSGFHQAAAYGDYYVLSHTAVLNDKTSRKKVKKGEKFVQYQGLSVGNFFFNRRATTIRSNSVSQNMARCLITTDMNIYEAENVFPGITDIAQPGDIPSTLQEDNPTDLSSDSQQAYDRNKSIQIGFFFDLPNQVFSIRAGSNNANYKTVKGDEFEKAFSIWWRGRQEPMIPLSGFGMIPRTETIYSSGLIETFYRIAVNEGLLQGSLTNNVLDSNYSPIILNAENAEAGVLLKQLKKGKEATERGERAVIIPNEGSKNQAGGTGRIGKADVSYIKPHELTGENEKLMALFDKIIKRMGYNLDINFTDPNKTLGQTEIDIQSANRNISTILGRNSDFFEFNYSVAVDRIIKYGNEKDDTVFGRDVKIDIKGEEVPLTKLVGQDLTVGFMVKLFREAKDTMRLQINTKSGNTFNDVLENRSLRRRLQTATPGSPEFLRIQSALSILNGGKALTQKDIQGQDGQQQQIPQNLTNAQSEENL